MSLPLPNTANLRSGLATALRRPPLLLGAALILAGCSPSSRAPERKTVIPTPAVLSMQDDSLQRIGVRVIVVSHEGAQQAPSDVTRSAPEAKERADMVSTIAQMSGEHFIELQRQYSDHPPLQEGGGPGALLERGSGLLSPAAQAAAFRLAVGEVSAPVKTPRGYLVLKRTETPQRGPTQIGARHILIAYKGATRASPDVTRKKEEARELAREIRTRLAEGADWNTLWKKYSDEPSKQTGGDLGLFSRGQMVPPFEQAAFALDIDEISPVVETPYGFHVIQRTR